MRERASLTAVWLISFITALLLVESYIGRHNSAGMRILLDEDRLDALKPLAELYAGYIAGILGFWFAKPFKEIKNDRVRFTRFCIALVCTIIFNAVVLYMVGHEYIASGGNVISDIHCAVKIAAWLSVVVAPINLYYFGMKPPTSS